MSIFSAIRSFFSKNKTVSAPVEVNLPVEEKEYVAFKPSDYYPYMHGVKKADPEMVETLQNLFSTKAEYDEYNAHNEAYFGSSDDLPEYIIK